MPFTSAGVKPDIIINPHAIPSRMTIGQLKETLLGKVLVELGLFGDGTSFGDLSIDTIRKELTKVGYESNGNEVMYNGLNWSTNRNKYIHWSCILSKIKAYGK